EGFGLVVAAELMGVAGEAVTAGHLAAPIGVERPAKRHRPGVEPVYELRRPKFTILHTAPLVECRPHSPSHPRRRDSRLDPHSRHVLSIQYQRKTRGPEGVPGSLSTGASLRRRQAPRPDAGLGRR